MRTVVRTETRKRSGWGKWWLFSFIAFNALMAFDALYITQQVGTLRKSVTGLGHLGLNIAANQKLNEHFTIWIAGAVMLGLLVWLTRGRLVVTEIVTDGPPSDHSAPASPARPRAGRP